MFIARNFKEGIRLIETALQEHNLFQIDFEYNPRFLLPEMEFLPQHLLSLIPYYRLLMTEYCMSVVSACPMILLRMINLLTYALRT